MPSYYQYKYINSNFSCSKPDIFPLTARRKRRIKALDSAGVLTIGTVRTDLVTNDQTGDLGIGKRIIPVVRAYDHPDEHGTTPGEIALKNTKNTYKNPCLVQNSSAKIQRTAFTSIHTELMSDTLVQQ